MSERLDNERLIFALLFKTSNKLQTYLDRTLKRDGLTVKQMFLMINIHSFGNDSPSFKEAAERMGTSYQNVKQLALKLSNQGFVSIKDDVNDKRTKRLLLTEKARVYWSNRDNDDEVSMISLFNGVDNQTIKLFSEVLMQLDSNLDKME